MQFIAVVCHYTSAKRATGIYPVGTGTVPEAGTGSPEPANLKWLSSEDRWYTSTVNIFLLMHQVTVSFK